MQLLFLISGTLIILLIFVLFFRIIAGPTVMDRVLCVNVIGTKSTILILIAGILFDRLEMFVDIAIAYAFLNFIASIVISRYLSHTKEIDYPEIESKFVKL